MHGVNRGSAWDLKCLIPAVLYIKNIGFINPMKRKYFILVLFCTVPFMLFHSRTPGNLEEAVSRSPILGTGIIRSVIRNESRCSTDITARVEVLTILKGSLNDKPLLINISEHHWRKAFWPWQDDCPSVHYQVPPIEVKIEKNTRIVFAAECFEGYTECSVTAAASCDREDEFKKYAGIGQN